MNDFYTFIFNKIENDLNTRDKLNIKSINRDTDIIFFLSLINKITFNEIIFELNVEFNNVSEHMFNLSETKVSEYNKNIMFKFIYLLNKKNHVFNIKLVNQDSFLFNELLKNTFIQLLSEEYGICLKK